LYEGTNVENTDSKRTAKYTKPFHHHSEGHFNTDSTLTDEKVAIVVLNVYLIGTSKDWNYIFTWLVCIVSKYKKPNGSCLRME
jgi:hypothetical protein